MAPVFASADIAALVAAFPPPAPSRGQSSLVRSLSGDQLLSSDTILTRFHKLIEHGTGRMNIKDLPSLLGIRDTQWLFDCYQGPIHVSNKRVTVLTASEFNKLRTELRSRADQSFISASSFAKDQDITLDSALAALEHENSIVHFRIPGSRQDELLSSAGYVERTKNSVLEMVCNAGSEKVQLSKRLPNVPSHVLNALFQDVSLASGKVEGELEETAEGLVFVPSSYHFAVQEQLRQEHVSMVGQAVIALIDEGWTVFPPASKFDPSTLQRDVLSRFLEQAPPTEQPPACLSLTDGRAALVRNSVLKREMNNLRSLLTSLVRPNSSVEPIIGPIAEAELIKRSWTPPVATLLLNSQHRKELEDSLSESLVELRRAKFLQFQKSFQNTLTAPLHLHAAGIFEDSTLKQHQEDYLLEYFRSDLIPNFVKGIQPQDLDTDPKIRLKDIEKMASQCSSAQRFADLQSAVAKFERKYEMPTPSPTLLISTKRETLHQKGKALQRIKRGSDVLQNLIWILLSQKREGLFMTSGKDTSRMIKQYQLIGDQETGQKLEHWKDTLKRSDGDHQAAVNEMRLLAERVLEEMIGDKQQDGQPSNAA